MNFAGIDCGSKGALAIIDQDDEVLVFSFDSYVKYLEILNDHSHLIDLVGVEKLWAVPPSSAVTNFNLGSHFGRTQLVLELAKVKSIEVAAKTWQIKILNFRGSKKDRASKKASIDYVNKRFPSINLRPKTLKDIDEMSGIADAICIALYTKYIYTNGE